MCTINGLNVCFYWRSRGKGVDPRLLYCIRTKFCSFETNTHTKKKLLLSRSNTWAPVLTEYHPKQCLSPVATWHVSVSNTSHTAALKAKSVKQSAISARCEVERLQQSEMGRHVSNRQREIPAKPCPTKTPVFRPMPRCIRRTCASLYKLWSFAF